MLFDCTRTVAEDLVVDVGASTYLPGNKLLLLAVRRTPPPDLPSVFRIAGQETFLIWTEPLAKRVRKLCAGAVVLLYPHAP